MIYSSPEFVLLLLATVAAYRAASGQRLRFGILLAASALFYAWAGLFDTLIFAFVIVFSWACVALSERYPAQKRWLIPAGVTLAAAHLFFWKYWAWVVSQIQVLHPSFLGGRAILLPLPLGISFFTLQSVAYLVDYANGEAPYVPFTSFALFKGFFAQLIAGPIVRAHELFPQLENLKDPDPSDVTLGLTLFAIGFIKKVAIADRVSFYVDQVFGAPVYFGRAALLKALLGYTVQIWADFSGYVDMGRGAALLFGIRLPENFRSPYLSRSPLEFWNRWHITLSEWIRDYLFFPLATRWDGRLGMAATLVVTMFLAGLWHGAAWTFVLFGFYHGAFLAADSLGWFTLPRLIAGRLRSLLLMAMTLVFAAGGWLLFRIENLAQLSVYWHGLVFGREATAAEPGSRSLYAGMAFCLLYQIATYYDLGEKRYLLLEPCQRLIESARNRSWLVPGLAGLTLGAALGGAVFVVIYLRVAHSAPFIYFQF